jgi:hypothetical protein
MMWKIASVARTSEQHRHKTRNSAGNNNRASHGYNPIDPKLQSLYSQLDAADATLRALRTLAKRRVFAIKSLRPTIDATQRMEQFVGREDPEVTGLFSDKLYMSMLR